jgi:hypothetical protein
VSEKGFMVQAFVFSAARKKFLKLMDRTSVFVRRHDYQHNDIQHNDIHHNDTQHNDVQHNDIQHNDTQNNDIKY